MTVMLEHSDTDFAIYIPISEGMKAQAIEFAQVQPSPEKSTQVEQNTLAVLAMNTYLQWQNYSTDLEVGDSWNVSTQLLGDVADLMIEGLGRIECRPILTDEEVCPLPPEVWHNRIGYVVVQLQLEIGQARLLGFIPAFDPEDPLLELRLKDLLSLDDLISYFDRLEKGRHELENNSSPEAEQVRQMWKDSYSRLMLIAQLERIYRNESPNRWRVKGEKILSGRALECAVIREESVPANRIELQGVAEKFIKILANIWEKTSE